jgi:hypothetical protein
MRNLGVGDVYRILHLGLAVALVIGVAGCARGEKQAGNVSYVGYTNDDLGFAAQFPSKPSETSKKEEDNGRTFTTYRIYGKNSSTAESMVTVIDGFNELPIEAGLDAAWKETLSAMLVDRYSPATRNADAGPNIEFGRLDGNLSATTVFPWTDDSGKDIWIYYVVLMRDDGRFYELTGSRPTEGDAVAAAASFRLLPSGDKQVSRKPASAKPQIPDGAIKWTEAKKHVGETVTVFGPVKGSKYASTSNGEPTFIDLGASYPDPSRVSIVVWGEDRDSFSGSPEEMYLGKTIAVTGEVYMYRGACNIEVQSPSQVRVLE